MPGYRMHLAAGISLFLLVSLVVQPDTYAANLQLFITGLCAVICGSLFPDIDTKSQGQRLYSILLLTCVAYVFWYKQLAWMPMLLIASLFPLLTSHRGITHDPKFVLAVGALMAYGGMYCTELASSHLLYVTTCFTAAALVHILLDYGPWGFVRRCIRFSVR